MATQDSSNLYARLGGVYSIATVVDDLIDRVMADQRLNANPLVDEAHHKVPPAGFKYLVTEMLCWAAGGPQKYTGKDMESSHRHLRITPGEWEAFMDDLAQTQAKPVGSVENDPKQRQSALRQVLPRYSGEAPCQADHCWAGRRRGRT